MLDGAAAAAARMGDAGQPLGPSTIGSFCPATVTMKRVEAADIADRPDRALTLAAGVPPSNRPTSNNRNRHLLDVAQAYTRTGAHAEATGVLLEIRGHAPVWLRHQRLARDVVQAITGARRRAMTPELADLAALGGLPG